MEAAPAPSLVVLKTVPRLEAPPSHSGWGAALWVGLGACSYVAGAVGVSLAHAHGSTRDGSWAVCPLEKELEQQTSAERQLAHLLEWQTAAFAGVLALNSINLVMRQHSLRFKCNMLLVWINAVAFVTDFLLWQGLIPAAVTASGRLFYPLRYIQWAHTTPTMLYMLAMMSGTPIATVLPAIICDVAMILTGMLACYTTGLAKVLFAALSFGTFGVVIVRIRTMFQRAITPDLPPERAAALRCLMRMLLAVWTAFTVVWLLADLNLISVLAEHVCWGICDYLAKVVFSSQLWQGNLSSAQQRTDRALRAWEDSNRVIVINRLRALLAGKERLLHTLSHELKTPLLGILALTINLQQELAKALGPAEKPLAMIRATVTCLLNVINATLKEAAAANRLSQFGNGGRAGPTRPPGGGLGGQLGLLANGGRVPVLGGQQGGGLQAPWPPLQLQPLINQVVALLQPLLHDGVQLLSDFPAELPPVAADSTRLSQVLFNLVGNAARFTSKGHVRISARVVDPSLEQPDAVAVVGLAAPAGSRSCARPSGLRVSVLPSNGWGSPRMGPAGPGAGRAGGAQAQQTAAAAQGGASAAAAAQGGPLQVEVEVEDTGIGIPEDQIGNIFQPYRQADDTIAASYGGTGLGLYLVKLALEAHGATITVESRLGLGSCFRFRLPVAAPSAASQPAAPPAAGGAATAASPAGGADGAGAAPGRVLSAAAMSAAAAALCTPPAAAATSGLSSSSGGPCGVTTGDASCGVPASPTVADPQRVRRSLSDPSRSNSDSSSFLCNLTPHTINPILYDSMASGMFILSGDAMGGAQPVRQNYRSGSGGVLQVMSVDDDAINQMVAEQMLASQKWKVVKCMDGMSALKYLLGPGGGAVPEAEAEAGPAAAAAAGAEPAAEAPPQPELPPVPDLLMLDIMMPGMSGFEVCSALRKHFPSSVLPIIMVSAKHDEESVEEAFRCGADDYVAKPYKRTELAARIRAHVRARDEGAAAGSASTSNSQLQLQALKLLQAAGAVRPASAEGPRPHVGAAAPATVAAATASLSPAAAPELSAAVSGGNCSVAAGREPLCGSSYSAGSLTLQRPLPCADPRAAGVGEPRPPQSQQQSQQAAAPGAGSVGGGDSTQRSSHSQPAQAAMSSPLSSPQQVDSSSGTGQPQPSGGTDLQPSAVPAASAARSGSGLERGSGAATGSVDVRQQVTPGKQELVVQAPQKQQQAPSNDEQVRQLQAAVAALAQERDGWRLAAQGLQMALQATQPAAAAAGGRQYGRQRSATALERFVADASSSAVEAADDSHAAAEAGTRPAAGTAPPRGGLPAAPCIPPPGVVPLYGGIHEVPGSVRHQLDELWREAAWLREQLRQAVPHTQPYGQQRAAAPAAVAAAAVGIGAAADVDAAGVVFTGGAVYQPSTPFAASAGAPQPHLGLLRPFDAVSLPHSGSGSPYPYQQQQPLLASQLSLSQQQQASLASRRSSGVTWCAAQLQPSPTPSYGLSPAETPTTTTTTRLSAATLPAQQQQQPHGYILPNTFGDIYRPMQ